MEESKIVQYIFAFSAKERDKFVQFVESPFFNQHEKTIELLHIIVKQANRKYVKLEKKSVYAQLFPNKKYQEQKIHNLLANLKKLLHRYYAVSYLDENPLMGELMTIETAFKRKQFDLLKNRSKQLQKHLSDRISQDDTYYYVNYRMNNMLGYYSSTYVNRSKSTSLQTMMNHLDRYYILEKLKNSCHLYAHHLLMNAKYDWSLLDDIVQYLQDHTEEFKDDNSIHLYYTILMSLRSTEDNYYYLKLKELLVERVDQFSQLEKEDLYNFTNNYCILQINRGKSAYQEELFELYQQGLESEVIFQNDILTEWNYKNIVTLGAKLKRFDWTERFINEHKDKLPASQRENAYKYNLANLYYTKGKYQEVLSNLLHVQYTDVKYHLSSSFLLLRTYYKLEDTEAMLGLIDTFRIYVLRNNQMTSDQKKGYINFLKLVKKLVLLKHQYHAYSKSEVRQKLADLREKVLSTENVINRSWLVEECGEPSAVAS